MCNKQQLNANKSGNSLKNPIKNIRRENSLPPETTDLSFEEADPKIFYD